jgi:hypothetical protein
MNPEAVRAVLPASKENALSLNDIALALGLDISSYKAMGRTKRQLSKTLSALIKWGWVDCDFRQNANGNTVD